MAASVLPAGRPVPDVSGRDIGRSSGDVGVTSKQEIDTDEYLTGLRRMLRALSRRVAEGDPEALRSMVALRSELEDGITEAVTGLRHDPEFPASWTHIAEALGMSRRNVIRRYGTVGGARRAGGQPGNWR